VPGVSLLNVTFEKVAIGHLVEYEDSEAARAWSEHFHRRIRHFQLFFLYENQRLDVFGEAYSLQDATYAK
jgi:hypothetical protein